MSGVAPEPHVLLFRRPKNFDAQLRQHELELQHQMELAKAARTGGGAARKK